MTLAGIVCVAVDTINNSSFPRKCIPDHDCQLVFVEWQQGNVLYVHVVLMVCHHHRGRINVKNEQQATQWQEHCSIPFHPMHTADWLPWNIVHKNVQEYTRIYKNQQQATRWQVHSIPSRAYCWLTDHWNTIYNNIQEYTRISSKLNSDKNTTHFQHMLTADSLSATIQYTRIYKRYNKSWTEWAGQRLDHTCSKCKPSRFWRQNNLFSNHREARLMIVQCGVEIWVCMFLECLVIGPHA